MHLFKSKTFWLNVISLIILILALLEFISLIPASVIPLVTLGNAILNLILRIFFTSTAITKL